MKDKKTGMKKMANNQFKLTLENRDEIAKKAIDLVNKYKFDEEEKKAISNSFLRNLLDFINSPNNTPNQFTLFVKYQAGRQGKTQQKFAKELLHNIKIFSRKVKAKTHQDKNKINKEFIVDIVMGGTYRKAVKDKEEINTI